MARDADERGFGGSLSQFVFASGSGSKRLWTRKPFVMLIDGDTVIGENTPESVRKPVVDVIVIRNPVWPGGRCRAKSGVLR